MIPHDSNAKGKSLVYIYKKTRNIWLHKYSHPSVVVTLPVGWPYF